MNGLEEKHAVGGGTDNLAHFLETLAVMGGLLMVVALEVGVLSLDTQRQRL